ncbi:colicin immunity domain-containing protein [Rhodovulum sulfidophilum]|uniref:colicin immunity domain-containing protein n=1 Tax=Rhodovulum sulfidophilum TaxID=35806 RepID=UPI0019227FCE|nr:colicin immunity domain-containing protein [Rhodovulum sulfidophilum]MBL3576300.1 hypothetical protein [Rhodovulum sulfidophilum]MCF4118978.1 colicin immunity domain-containing protein [Rhodovulum sulfidophilum]
MEVQKYITLLSGFLSGEVSAPNFETRYIRTFKGKTSLVDESSFRALNDLFFDGIRIAPIPSLRDDDDPDEGGLRSRVKEALEVLAKNKILP